MASLWEIRSVDQLALALRDNVLSPKLWRYAGQPSFEKLENKGKFDASIEAVQLGSLRAVRVKVPASRFQFPDCGGMRTSNYIMIMQQSGISRISCSKQMMTLMPGDWGLIMRPGQLIIENSDHTEHTLILPNRELSESLKDIKAPGLYRAPNSYLLTHLMHHCLYEVMSQKTALEKDLRITRIIPQMVCNVSAEIFKDGWVDVHRPREFQCSDESIRQYIKQHANDHNLSVAEVAKAFNCSPRTIHRHLAKRGVTFESLLLQWRLDAAVEMIGRARNDKIYITQIALESGFSNSSAFSTHFKKKMGVSPSEYLKMGSASPSTHEPSPASSAARACASDSTSHSPQSVYSCLE